MEYTEERGDFENFIEDITGNSEGRKTSLMTLIGYLMHDYYDYDLRAVFLTDVNYDFEERAGRTGKGIIGKAIARMLNKTQDDTTYVSIPAPYFQKGDPKRFSRADINTQLLHLEDAVKGFSVEDLITDITDGVQIQRHYQNPFSKFLKIMVSMNFSPDFKGPTLRGRAIIFELTNYFSDTYRPSAKYKYFWGNSWTQQDYNQFYSFMIRCCFLFMRDGIQEPGEMNYNNRVLMQSTNEEFVIWFTEQIEPYQSYKTEHEFEKEQLFNEYVHSSIRQDTLSAYKKPRTTFTHWCQSYCRLKNIDYCEYRSTRDLFIIFPKQETKEKCIRQRKKIQNGQMGLF
jgi:hypothetical protein